MPGTAGRGESSLLSEEPEMQQIWLSNLSKCFTLCHIVCLYFKKNVHDCKMNHFMSIHNTYFQLLMSIYPSKYLFIYLKHLSIHKSYYDSISQFIVPSKHLSIYISIYLYIYLSICICIPELDWVRLVSEPALLKCSVLVLLVWPGREEVFCMFCSLKNCSWNQTYYININYRDASPIILLSRQRNYHFKNITYIKFFLTEA